jgi:hypothetical protein
MDNHIIDWMLSLDNSLSFDPITREAYRHIKGNRYTSGSNKYILENEHAYFYGDTLPLVVKIKLLAGDPLEAAAYPSFCAEEDCTDCLDCESPVDKEFSIDEELVDTVIELAVPELVGIFNQGIEDKTNNTSDNPSEGSK